MDIIIKNLIYFFASFVIVFLVYLLFINRKKRNGREQLEINYLIGRFNLDSEETNYKALKVFVALINSFIMSFTFTIITNFEINYILKLCIAFVVLMILIYSLYEILGRALKKKETKSKKKEKNNKKTSDIKKKKSK